MDDIKRAVYLEALQLIKKEETSCIYIALSRAINTILRTKNTYYNIAEFFPEFINLYDNNCWNKNKTYKRNIFSLPADTIAI